MRDQPLPNGHRDAGPQAHVGAARAVQEGEGAAVPGEDGARRVGDHLRGGRVSPWRYVCMYLRV